MLLLRKYYLLIVFFLLATLPATAAPGAQQPHPILLNSGTIDTSSSAMQVQANPGSFTGRQMWLVQFAGPIQPEWYATLEQTGVQIVAAVPDYAYLVYGTQRQLTALNTLASANTSINWLGEYRSSYRIDPALQSEQAARVMVQLIADHKTNPATLALMNQLSTSPLRIQYALQYLNVLADLPAGTLNTIAAQPDVLSLQPYSEPTRHDESQGQIIAGNHTANSPNLGDYLAWLQARGFTQAQFDAAGFVVDVTDAGIDTGTLQPNHFALYANGIIPGTSRVAYSRLAGTPSGVSSTLAGVDGHGTLNAHIIGGYVPSGAPYNTFPHADAQGFRYGLGIAPFVRIGASVIFDNGTTGNDYTFPDYEDLLAQSYQDNARMVNNSWGSPSSGNYTVDSQRYDALVRDAQPSGSAVATAGNQEMVIVFSAGNYGPTTRTLGMPATAKNVISVGASEGIRAIGGADGCGYADGAANNLNEIADFSSRGPTADGRFKPDLVAPGTHITAGVWQNANPGLLGSSPFTGTGICGAAAGANFFPNGQQWYSISTGTSHSAPAVTAATALLRQYFINAGQKPPSPAMTKAYLMNSAQYLTGISAGDTLPSQAQGMGLLDLGRAFDAMPRLLRDQELGEVFSESGQQRMYAGGVADSSQPVRITLAWTDAPGTTFAAAYVNNLDLQVTIGGTAYFGNSFSGAFSLATGSADPRNNVESVILPAGLPIGTPIIITITATNIAGDGVPNQGGPLDQDFALVATNMRSYSVILPLVSR
jgi:Subtilase family